MKIHPKKLYYLDLNGNLFTYNYNSLNKQNNTIIDLIFKCKDCHTYSVFNVATKKVSIQKDHSFLIHSNNEDASVIANRNYMIANKYRYALFHYKNSNLRCILSK